MSIVSTKPGLQVRVNGVGIAVGRARIRPALVAKMLGLGVSWAEEALLNQQHAAPACEASSRNSSSALLHREGGGACHAGCCNSDGAWCGSGGQLTVGKTSSSEMGGGAAAAQQSEGQQSRSVEALQIDSLSRLLTRLGRVRWAVCAFLACFDPSLSPAHPASIPPPPIGPARPVSIPPAASHSPSGPAARAATF